MMRPILRKLVGVSGSLLLLIGLGACAGGGGSNEGHPTQEVPAIINIAGSYSGEDSQGDTIHSHISQSGISFSGTYVIIPENSFLISTNGTFSGHLEGSVLLVTTNTFTVGSLSCTLLAPNALIATYQSGHIVGTETLVDSHCHVVGSIPFDVEKIAID